MRAISYCNAPVQPRGDEQGAEGATFMLDINKISDAAVQCFFRSARKVLASSPTPHYTIGDVNAEENCAPLPAASRLFRCFYLSRHNSRNECCRQQVGPDGAGRRALLSPSLLARHGGAAASVDG